ncbi:hypothetical protein DL96DRAFT_117022 [Flagelloscypha sp. PMI_526]|nr:hypothetical protein DL96DRAFT_117022 [Flagelloscypha sp. PMI_526]
MYVSVTCGGVDNSTVGKIPRVALRRNRALEGDVVFYQHEFLRESRFRSFGFGRSNYAIVGEIKSISNDPTYSIPNNISYLKYRYSPTEDVVSIGTREHIDNTVIDALAAIGGIWTFGNGLFALVFGGSLLYFLLGLRPLSRFGLVHLFIRARLRRATREMYPNFHCEGGQPGEAEAGVVSFIRQHLLGVVGDEEEEEKRKQRRRQWEQQRDEMELISFEVSHAFEANPQHLSSTTLGCQFELMLHDECGRAGSSTVDFLLPSKGLSLSSR